MTDNCNIKCKSCGHFSCLVDKERDTSISAGRIHQNMEHIAELFPSLNTLSILGGEPLLHPDLDRILDKSRQLYPYADIYLVTNGILLTRMSDTLIDCIYSNHIVVNYSVYPKLISNFKKNINFLEENCIEYILYNAFSFHANLSKNPIYNGKKINQTCGACIDVSDKFIAKCPLLNYVHYYNEKFGDIYPDNGRINIYHYKSGEELLKEINKGGELCNYCSAIDTCQKDWDLVTDKTVAPSDWWNDNVNNL